MDKVKRLARIQILLGAFLAFGASTIQAAPLESRLGGLAYYDPNLDITWATFINPSVGSVTTWDEQVTWAATVEIGGVTGWRLPNADVDGDGMVVNCETVGASACLDNELGYLFHQEGIGASTPDPFPAGSTSVGYIEFWTGTEFSSDTDQAWIFFTNVGSQDTFPKNQNNNKAGWAVRSGDVAAVPVPAAIFLFGPALTVLGFIRRR